MNSANLVEDLRLLSPPDYRMWWVAVALVLAVAGGIALIRMRRQHSRLRAAPASDPAALPWDLALAELDRLVPLLQREHSRDYGIASTTILRSYIEARYGLRAPKLATEEFLMLSRESPSIPEAHRAGLRHYLEWCDLLKFGCYVGAVSELASLHGAAVNFVLASRPADSDGITTRTAADPVATVKKK